MRTLIGGLLVPMLLSAHTLRAQQPCTAERGGQCAPAAIAGIAKDETTQAWTPVTAALGTGPLDTFIRRPSSSSRHVFQRNRDRGLAESVPVPALVRPNGAITRASARVRFVSCSGFSTEIVLTEQLILRGLSQSTPFRALTTSAGDEVGIVTASNGDWNVVTPLVDGRGEAPDAISDVLERLSIAVRDQKDVVAWGVSTTVRGSWELVVLAEGGQTRFETPLAIPVRWQSGVTPFVLDRCSDR
jgi:hypothetical protein